MKEIFGYFEVEGRAIHAGLYKPEGKPRLAVLLCEPFGEEKRCSYRMMVRLARALAERGCAVLRFDLSGTGDSAGGHDEATWEHWHSEAAAALSMIDGAGEGAPTCVCAFRAGALLAAKLPGVTRLALCEPIWSGEELLADWERRQKIKEAMGQGAPAGTTPEGVRDFGGLLVSDALAGQLRQVRIAPERLPDGGRTLLLRVTGAKSFPPAWQPYCARCDARLIADKPFWGQVEYFESNAVLEPVVEFCQRVMAAAASSPPAHLGVS
ncbi:MAG: hypothetical protein IJJ33_14525 [Victivallales bacterium]|nr:hypothetical protein [Victivallales bacterium]